MGESNAVAKNRGWGLTIVIPVMIISSSWQVLQYLYHIVTSGSLYPTISIG